MSREVTGASKLLVAELTLVILYAQMGFHVRVKVGAASEGGATLAASEGSLTGVRT